jgi:hypothetical protein
VREQRVASRRCEPEAELRDDIRREPPPIEQLAPAAAGLGREHVAIERRRDLVQRDQVLAVRVGRRVVPRVAPFRDGDAELARHDAHRLGEAETLVQLHELEHVAADAAAEAVEDAELAIDAERRRLLVVERTEADVAAADAAQRHHLLHHLHDVGLLPQVVQEAFGKERHQSFSSTTVTPSPP